MISGIVLAAGESRRMGSPKALLDYQGRTFIENICDAFVTAGVDELIVVLGAHEHEEKIRAAVPDHRMLQVTLNPRHRLGQLSSLMAGIHALSSESEAAVVNLVDHPSGEGRDDTSAYIVISRRPTAHYYRVVSRPTGTSGPIL